jgi:hypothetical protein
MCGDEPAGRDFMNELSFMKSGWRAVTALQIDASVIDGVV